MFKNKIKNFFTAIMDLVDPYRVGPWNVKYNFLIFMILLCVIYAIYLLLERDLMPRAFNLLWYLNIGIHEAGHPIFYWIGFGNEFLHYAGGTLMEFIVPGTAFFTFLRRNKPIQADFCFMWLGYSWYSVGHYAKSTSLPEVTLLNAGPGTISDWEYFHEYFGTWMHDVAIGHAMYLIGAAFAVFATYSMLCHFKQMTEKINHDI